MATAAAREEQPSLVKMLATWRCTVCLLRVSDAAIAASLTPLRHQREDLPFPGCERGPVLWARSIVVGESKKRRGSLGFVDSP